MFRNELIKSKNSYGVNLVTDGFTPQSADKAITPIVVANSIIILKGYFTNDLADNGRSVSVKIKDSTTVTAYITTGTSIYLDVIVFDVIEFYPGVIFNCVSDVIDCAPGASGSTTVTIGTRTGILLPAFMSPNISGATFYLTQSGTTITANNNNGFTDAGNTKIGFCYFEI